MSVWYRVSQINNIKQVFSGDGGLSTAARWNHLGRKVIYCSDSIALCTLEWLSHNGLSVSGFDYYRYSLEIPDKLLKKYLIHELPTDWDKTPATNLTRDFAEQQLFGNEKHLGLILPSVMVPEEFNVIINPLHSEFNGIINSAKMIGKFSAPKRNWAILRK